MKLLIALALVVSLAAHAETPTADELLLAWMGMLSERIRASFLR